MGSFTITSTISLYDWWYGGMLVSWVVVESERYGDSDRHLSTHIDLPLPLLFNVGLYDE